MNYCFKNILFFLALNTVCINVVQSIQPMISVVSWNILGPNTQDVVNFFTRGDYNRVNKVINRIATQVNGTFGPSIICFQEVDLKSRSMLQKAFLPKYIELDYQSKGVNGGVILLVKKSEFSVIDHKALPLDNGGAAVVGLIKSSKTGAIFAVSSLHIGRSNYQSVANTASGERQLKQIQDVVHALEALHNLNSKKVYKIYAGDYNTDILEFTNSTLCFLSSNDSYHCYAEAFSGANTVNDAQENFRGIDHIVASDDLMITNYSKIIGNTQGVGIHKQIESDHAVLYAVYLDIKKT